MLFHCMPERLLEDGLEIRLSNGMDSQLAWGDLLRDLVSSSPVEWIAIKAILLHIFSVQLAAAQMHPDLIQVGVVDDLVLVEHVATLRGDIQCRHALVRSDKSWLLTALWLVLLLEHVLSGVDHAKDIVRRDCALEVVQIFCIINSCFEAVIRRGRHHEDGGSCGLFVQD